MTTAVHFSSFRSFHTVYNFPVAFHLSLLSILQTSVVQECYLSIITGALAAL